MKSTAALSLLLLLPGIQAVALPQGHNSRFKSDLGTLFNEARDFIGNSPVANGPVAKMLPRKGDRAIKLDRSPVAKMLARKRKEGKAIKLHRSPTKVVRSPQGPDSNPGESIDPGLSRLNPANSKPSSDTMASSAPMVSSSAMSPSTNSNDTMDADIEMMVMDGGYDHHHNHSHHNGTHHNGTHHHRDHGYHNGSWHHGEHNRTHHNGTHHHHHNETKHDLEMDMDMEMYILNATFGASGTGVPAVPGPTSTGSAPIPTHDNVLGDHGPGFTGPKAKREMEGKENKWLSGIF